MHLARIVFMWNFANQTDVSDVLLTHLSGSFHVKNP